MLHRIGLAPGFEVVIDPDPNGFRSPWRTYRHALNRTPPGRTHRVIVQDDVVVSPGFETEVEAAIAERPSDVISFYCGVYPYENSIAVSRAHGEGRRWAVLGTSSWVPVVCLAWPVWLIPNVLRNTPPGDDPIHWSDDANVGGWFRSSKHPPPICRVPTLVDHPDDLPSLIGAKSAPYRRGIALA
jgi:hypothetical protein